MDLLRFFRNVTKFYLSLSRKGNRQSFGRTPKPESVPECVVSDPEGYFPMKLEKQQHCAVCHARVRWSCKKSLKTLCMERDCLRGSIQGNRCCKLCASGFFQSLSSEEKL